MSGSSPGSRERTLHLEEGTGPPSDWDGFVGRVEGGTFCHLAGWNDVMSEVMGHRTFYGVVRDSRSEIQGVLPLVFVKSRIFGSHLVSMPFLNYGGPLGTLKARRILAEWALRSARELEADVLELRCRSGGGDPTDLSEELDIRERKVTVLLRLPEDPDILWKDGLRSKVRSQIRRPMKEGMESRSGPEELEAFYQVFARNMRDLGTPVLPESFFRALRDVFPEEIRFAAVYSGDLPVAAGCGFRKGGEFEITWASSLREFNREAPNMLLYWSMMTEAIEEGLEVFNFGRCTPGGGTHRFKLQWGGQDEPLPWAVWSPKKRAGTPTADQGGFRLASALWQRLPVGVSRLLGPPLARRIP